MCSSIVNNVVRKNVGLSFMSVSPSSRSLFQWFYCLPVLFCLMFSANIFAEPDVLLDDESSVKANTREYRIGAEDVLRISVWKEKELQRDVIVRPDGGISFPFAGDLRAEGRTPALLELILTKRIQRFIPDALVTVSITKLAGLRIYVIGKVKKSGQFVIGRYVDVLQALTLAGGLDPYASEKNIKILRRDKNGREQVFPFNYNKVKNGEKLGQNILLQNDDVVVVP